MMEMESMAGQRMKVAREGARHLNGAAGGESVRNEWLVPARVLEEKEEEEERPDS